MAVDFAQEGAGIAYLHFAVHEATFRCAEVAAFAGTGDGYVEEASLFFHGALRVEALGRREEVFFHAYDEHGVELKAFGRVYRHEGHGFAAGVVGRLVLVGKQRYFAEEVGQVTVLLVAGFLLCLDKGVDGVEQFRQVVLLVD